MTLDRRFKILVTMRTVCTFAIGGLFATFVTLQMTSVSAQPTRPDMAFQDYKIDNVGKSVEQLRAELDRAKALVAVNADKINALQNEISTMRGFGIALSSIIGILQVAATLMGRKSSPG